MSRLTVWMRCLGSGWGCPPDELVAALARCDVGVCAASEPLPKGSGIALCNEVDDDACACLRELSREGRRVLVVAREARMLERGASWRLLAAGASDTLAWDRGDPAAAVAARLERWQEVDRLLTSALVARNLVGSSPAWRSALRQVVEIGRFASGSVLLSGESGTGKELVARLIHTLDGRPQKGELVIVDCTTIAPELSGSELFGHEKGAFTNAVSARDGAFALADGGTLFLDEVGELRPRMQAELLRVVQEGTYKRIGSNQWQKTSFRLVCATHRDLEHEIEQGRFRSDLFYRLATWRCRLPALAERREDVPLLARHFLAEVFGGEPPALEPAVRDYLMARAYPGNVRELRNLVLQIGQRHVGNGAITPGDVPAVERPAVASSEGDGWRHDLESAVRVGLALGLGLKELSNTAAEVAVEVALGEEEGNVQRAARRLGITDRALQMRQAARREKDASEG